MAQTTLKTSQLPVTVTVGDPGVDTSIPSEKAVRDALDSLSPVVALNDLSDVDTTGKVTGDVIYWDGANWVDVDPNTLITKAWGHLYQDDSGTTITVSATNTDYIVTGMSQGNLYNVTIQSAQELKIVTPGVYLVNWSLSFTTASANQEIEGAVGINGVRVASTSAHLKMLTGTDTGDIAGTGLIVLAANDLVQIVVRNETATANIGVQHCNLTIVYQGPNNSPGGLLLEAGGNLLLETGDRILKE